MPETGDVKSFKLMASVLKEEGGGKVKVLSFQPSGRAKDVADALVDVTLELKNDGKVGKVDLRHTEIEYGDGLSVYLAYISSDAVCQTCGAVRSAPTVWCHDAGSEKKGGCEKFRKEGVVEKPKADTSEQMAKMAKLLDQ